MVVFGVFSESQLSNFIIKFCSFKGVVMSNPHIQPFSNVPSAVPLLRTVLMLLMIMVLGVVCETLPVSELLPVLSACIPKGAAKSISEAAAARAFLVMIVFVMVWRVKEGLFRPLGSYNPDVSGQAYLQSCSRGGI